MPSVYSILLPLPLANLLGQSSQILQFSIGAVLISPAVGWQGDALVEGAPPIPIFHA